jgi:HK97 family phage major capsid protein
MSARTTDILELLEEQKDTHEAFIKVHKKSLDDLKTEMDQQRDRIEELEARGKSPGKTFDGRGLQTKAWRTYETAAGPIVELPASVKMADALPAKEQPPVSFERWLAAAMIGDRCEDKAALQFAREMKQLTTTTSGTLIPEVYQSGWIDDVRGQMVLNQAGMSTVGMEAKVYNASALVTDPTPSWHLEAGSINAGNPTFEARSLTSKTLVTRCSGSLEVSQDCPDFGAQLASAMARSMGVELDRVGLVGANGSPATGEPNGILGTSGVNQVTSVGSVSDYSKVLEGIRKLLEANVPLDVATKYAIMSPGAWAAFEGLPTGIASDKSQLARPRSLEAMQFLVTTNGLDVGSPATSTIFLGDFRDLVLGVRREASVEALKVTTYASNLVIEFIGYLRADYMLRRPKSFCTLEGVSV